MPYITKPKRDTFPADKINYLANCVDSPGELNYLLSQIVGAVLRRWGKSYTSINAIVGVLACLSLELYRRVASPYEDEKCKENGDVWPQI